MASSPTAPSDLQSPPEGRLAVLRRLGPGLIIAGSIVGSGELIMTTKTGAQAGFWLLWLIIVGCLIKVFAQVEFGRFSIVTGQTTMDGLAQVPGPRVEGRGNWIVWYWFLMFLASISQLGGVVGGVGQALAICAPLTEAGRSYNEYVDLATTLTVQQVAVARTEDEVAGGAAPPKLQRQRNEVAQTVARLAELDRQIIDTLGARRFAQLGNKPPPPWDDRIWASIVAAITIVVLVIGRYRFIQAFSTLLVASFTLITLVNLGLLQFNLAWRFNLQDVLNGLSFRLPPVLDQGTTSPIATALATFGIIGVGAAELVAYPYWCLEKGYARFTGPRDATAEWTARARGWMRVMRWDAWCSMVVYTFATVAFYLLGASVLGRSGLDPEKGEMIRTLSVMYVPVFGRSADILFLFGSVAVLYSTYFVANAGHARVFGDALRVLGIASKTEAGYRMRVRILSGLFPLLCLVIYLAVPAPVALVALSGLMQAVMLPMLAMAALFFRYRRCDDRVRPGRTWDLFLWVSAIGMSIAGLWALTNKLLSLAA